MTAHPDDVKTPSAGQSPCLSIQELIDFCVGKLNPDQIERVFAHLERCAQCNDGIRRLDALAVPFLTRIRDQGDAAEPAFLREPEYFEAVRRIQTLVEPIVPPCASHEPPAGASPERL